MTAPITAPKRSRALVFAPVVVALGLCALFAYALLSGGDPSKVPSALIGKPAPKVALPPIPGVQAPGFSTADLGKGEVTLVNVWASWCTPCVAEHPFLMRLKQSGAARIVGVNYKDTAEAARAFLARRGNPFEAAGFDADGRAGVEWGVTKVPETFVVDANGVVVFKLTGAIDAKNLPGELLPAIEKARANGQ
jgi:cytochrome c biogenesis protein CcmG/thiol:disulfide interchange protein DsbE